MAPPSGSGPTCDEGRPRRASCRNVAARDQGDSLLVVHRHAEERLADIAGGRDRIGFRWDLGIDVDEAHLDGAERRRQSDARRW